MFPGFGALFLAFLQGGPVQLVRGAPHGDLPQGGQIFRGEKVLERLFCLALPVYFSGLETLHQLIRLDIYQFHLIGPVKDTIGDAFMDRNACDGGY